MRLSKVQKLTIRRASPSLLSNNTVPETGRTSGWLTATCRMSYNKGRFAWEAAFFVYAKPRGGLAEYPVSAIQMRRIMVSLFLVRLLNICRVKFDMSRCSCWLDCSLSYLINWSGCLDG